MQIGDTFNSYAEFEIALNDFKNSNFVDFCIKDCKTISSQKNRYPRLANTSEDLKYYYIKLMCIHGGVHKKKKICQDQRKTSTMRQGCEAFIYLIINGEGNALEISRMNNIHNHALSEVLFNHLPNQRKMNTQSKSEVLELMQLRANKKLIQHTMQIKTGKIITLKDLSNIYSTGKISDSSLYKIVQKLRHKHNCTVEISVDSEENLVGLFIQDSMMQNIFEAFPEVVFADATYKLNNLRIPLYVLMVEDGNGESEVAALGLMTNEEKDTLRWFFETFKKFNSSSENIKMFMTDKDMTERQVIKEIFPNVSLAICLFHVLRTFNREITCEKQNISPELRDQLKQIFEKMCYAQSEDDYNSLCQHLESKAPKSVFEYFLKNWHQIRHEWVTGLTFHNGNMLNNTNNRLESFNGKLKSVIPVFTNIDDFVDKLFILLKCLRLERDRNAVNMVQKLPLVKTRHPDLSKYFSLLTPYSFMLVEKQFEAKSKTLSFTTINGCQCKFYVAMTLPCCHIFDARQKTNTSLYDENLCATRWTRKYYYEKQRAFQIPTTMHVQNHSTCNTSEYDDNNSLTVITKKNKKLSSHQKFRETSKIGSKIADLLSTLSNENFEKKIGQLKYIYNAWNEGKNLSINVDDTCSVRVENHSDTEDFIEEIEVDDTCSVQVENHSDTEDFIEEIEVDDTCSVQVENHSYKQTCSDTIATVVGTEARLKSIKLPSKIKISGRPKGIKKTTIGLLKKKKGLPIPFRTQSAEKKQEILLKWIVTDENIVTKALYNNYIIDDVSILTQQDEIHNGILEEDVDINMVKHFFTNGIWKSLIKIIDIKRKKVVWLCPTCQKDISLKKSILCDSCLTWFHVKCDICIKPKPKKANWFCSQCCDKCV
ncbi:zinc finger SWIM domain-containing protein 3-like isoform X10 [Aphis gossypii]|uniref:zinc finger SWIM domain-containing protein 3-like isoform X9 n=1 Tax=Aphis gossypii TaxID=80765 RepID=UPI0021598DB8|nr:zinc finger SWIM domain-containing protein 3-like isoform X9 [Aphis gossypii]XP_050055999.1 zinc finger SWIM domain-containing protein 3-like isoform X10 [Aphis gossypii]